MGVVRVWAAVAWLLGLAGAAGLLGGCAGDGTGTPAGAARYESATCPVPNFPGVPAADLGRDYGCGYLTVRENRSVEGGRTIRILVARVKAIAPTPKADPIVYLAGGPGGAGTLSAPGVVAGGMNADRDVIFVNQRGTIHSDPFLSCPEMDEFAARSIAWPYADEATAAADAASVAACRDRLGRTGADLSAYNSRENAADIAELREALGIAEWNVYGVSYGTDLALQLLRDHPEGIRSVVLDSVVPPNRNLIDQWWEAPASGLAAIAAACMAQPECAGAYPDLSTIFTATVNRLHAAPVLVEVRTAAGANVRVTIDGFKLISLLLEKSATPATVADFPRLIDNLARGDGTLAATAIAASEVPVTQRGLVGAGLALTTYCGEMANWTTPERALAQARIAMPALPDAVLRIAPTGSFFFAECRAWGGGRSDPALLAAAVSAVPTLILAGTFDSSTAPAWVGQVTTGLPHAVVLHFPGVGHGVIPTSACAQSIMTEYLDRLDAGVDRTCIVRMSPPAFRAP